MPIFKHPKSNNGSFTKVGNPSSQSSGQNSKLLQKASSSASSMVLDANVTKLFPPSVFTKAGSEAANISAFELLTNISSQRPEIISLLPFQPLYTDGGDATDAGRLFDSLIEYMRAIDESSEELASEKFSSLIKSQNKLVANQSEQLRRTLQTFYEVYRSLAKVRKSLTITNEYYNFSPTKLVNTIIKSDGDVDKSVLSRHASKMPEEMNVKNALKVLRYKDDKIDQFSPTISLLNLAGETRRILDYHSYELTVNKKKSPPGDALFSFPDRSYYKSSDERFWLPAWKTNVLDSLNFADISNFELSEDQQRLAESYEIMAQTLKDTSLDGTIISDYLEESYSEQGIAQNNNNEIVKVIATSLISFFKSNEVIFSKSLTSMGAIAAIIKQICREVRLSKKVSEEMMGSFSLDGGPTQYINNIFGSLNENVDVYQPVNMSTNSIMELSQIPVNNGNKKVLLFEQTPGIAWSKSCEAGGDYYFDPELLVNFANTSKLLSVKGITGGSAPDVAIRSRIIDLSNKVTKTSDDFYKCATEMGLLTLKDEVIFDGEKPKFFSNDPEKYLENIWNAIKDKLAIPPNTKLGFNNHSLGVKASISFAGSGNAESANAAGRIYLSVLSDVYEQEIEDLTNLNSQLMLMFIKMQQSIGIPSDVKNALTEIRAGILLALGYEKPSGWGLDNAAEIGGFITWEAAGGDVFKETNTKQLLFGYFQKAGIVPCVFHKYDDFGNALRNDPLYKTIVDIIKDLKKTLENYATTESATPTGGVENAASFQGFRRTKLNVVSINAILGLAFWAICRIVNLSSPYIIRAASPFNFLAGNGMGGIGGSGLIEVVDDAGEVNKKAYDYLVDIGLLNSEKMVPALSLYVNSGEVNNFSYPFLKSLIAEEMKMETMGVLTMLNTLQVLKKNIKNTEEVFTKLSAADYANLISFLGDPNKLSFLLKESQLTLALSNIEDVYQSFQNFSKDVDKSPDDSAMYFTKYYDKLPHSDKMVASLKKLFSANEFKQTKGYNKKIISIGLAQDLLKNTLPRYDFKKQNDIFRLSIYKIDNLNSDIIYKPKSYLFEASRYPSRVYSDYQQDLDSLQSIPTRNYSVTPDAKTIDRGETAFWNDISNSFGEEYSFLSQEEKEEILENHAMSLLLENYIKICTGLIVNETAFNLAQDEAEALLKELSVSSNAEEFAKATENKLLNRNPRLASGTSGGGGSGSGSGTTKQKSKISLAAAKSIYGKGIGKIATTLVKSLTIPAKFLFRYLVQPKKFDRVFNIIFDPEFEIDVKKTRSTSIGDKALTRLIKEGKIVAKYPRGLSAYAPVADVRYYDEDKTDADVSIESFFVVLESYDEDRLSQEDTNLLKKIPPGLASKIVDSGLLSDVAALKKPKGTSFAKINKVPAIKLGTMLNKLKP